MNHCHLALLNLLQKYYPCARIRGGGGCRLKAYVRRGSKITKSERTYFMDDP